MGEHLLRLLMVVCTLGAEWKDPEKIPVKDFINIWRSQSKSKGGPLRGRDLEGTHAEVVGICNIPFGVRVYPRGWTYNSLGKSSSMTR